MSIPAAVRAGFHTFRALVATLIIVLGLIGAGAYVVGCAQRSAVVNVGMPALTFDDAGVREDAIAGVNAMRPMERAEAEPAVITFFDALASGDRERFLAAADEHWPRVKVAARRGIAAQLDQGQIGPYGAEILRNRLEEFDLEVKRQLRSP